jgi:desulfoferrodoxin (superoxide reductase-like protein)
MIKIYRDYIGTMRKRAFERVTSSLQINFSYNNAVYAGIVTNLSENGMRINADDCPPFKSKFEVLFPLEGDVLALPVQVKRLIKRYDVVQAMGVELSNPSIKYIKFVKDLKWESSVMHSPKTDQEVSTYTCKLCGHIAFEQIPTECPICKAPIENYESNPYAIKKPQDPENLTEFEKNHIPKITISKINDPTLERIHDINVTIGEIAHTMTIDNHITFIDYYLQSPDIKKRCLGRAMLRCDKFQPSVSFYLGNVTSGNLTVISNCSAHGSWMSQIEIQND